jgi:RNA polymerase sigma factor (sigma-70 family)
MISSAPPPAPAEEADLLRRYAEQGAEEAFAELVRRHIGLAHSAARRQLPGEAAAADVTQAVFTELARQARRLARHPALAGWLYTTTRRLAARHVRGETRRRRREQEAHAMQQLARDEAPEPAWDRLGPVLDAAMHDLGETDRLAVLLRCFEQRPFAEVGVRLGLSENAARMRVDRALDRLRGHLARRGVTSTAAALALALGGHAVATVPASLATSVTAGALAGTAGPILGILTFMASTKLKAVAAAALVIGAGTALVMQHRAAERLRRDNAALRTELARVTAEAEATRQAAAPAVPARPGEELLALRGEVGRLRRDLADARRALAAKPPPPATPPRAEPVAAEEEAKEATQQFSIRRLNQAKMLMLGFTLLSAENEAGPLGDFTAAMERVAALGLEDGAKEIMESLNPAEFEMLYQGPLASIANPAEAIIFREREPWLDHEGRWMRAYGFADGHSEVRVGQNGDFSEYEAARQPKLRTAGAGAE